MKLDISKEIIDYEGCAILDNGMPLTVRVLLRMYAGSFIPEDDQNPAEQSVIANAVALKVHAATDGEVELTDEEYTTLKFAIAKPRHAALIYSQVHAVVYKREESK
jgi:hypothetical protein